MKAVRTGKTYIGVVEDNLDPERLGRCKIRVYDVHDKTPLENIPWANPWKDLAGNEFALPEKGKVVTVVFENANTDSPEFIFSDHHNINLEKKLKSLSEQDYLTMKSLMFDHKTQLYVNEGEGLKLDHKFNVINIRDTSINLNLKDNFSKINLGTANSTQRSILGDNFLNWFDDFVSILMGSKGGPFLGNLGAPVVATPALLGSLQLYQQLKDPKFLSKNVYIVDNENVAKLERIAEGQIGDTWQSTVKQNDIVSKEPVPYTPTEGSTNTTFDQPSTSTPIASTQSAVVQPEQPKPTPKENPDIKTIKELLKYKSYILYEDVMKMNIVAVRNQCVNPGDKYTDSFVDKLYLLYKKDEQNWELKQYIFSTVPGFEFQITDSWLSDKNLKNVEPWISSKGKTIFMKEYVDVAGEENGDPFLKEGLTILVPSQYIDLYFISQYRGAKSMNVIPGAKQLIWRDKDTTNVDQFNPVNFTNPEVISPSALLDNGLKIHLGYPSGVKVGSWSEGSQVFSNAENLNEFFSICEKHKEKYGNSFTYTLVTKTDWDEATRIADANKASDPLTTVSATPSTTGSTQSLTTTNNQIGATTSTTQQQIIEGNKSEVVDVFGDGNLLIDIKVPITFQNTVVTTDDIANLQKQSTSSSSESPFSVVFTIKKDSIPGQWEFFGDEVDYKSPSGKGYGQRATSLVKDKVIYDIDRENYITENLKDKEFSDLYGNYNISISINLVNKLKSFDSTDKYTSIKKTLNFKIEKGSASTSSESNSSTEYRIGILNPTSEAGKKIFGKIQITQTGAKKIAVGTISGFFDSGSIGPISSPETITSDNQILIDELMINLEDKIMKQYQTKVKLVVLDKK